MSRLSSSSSRPAGAASVSGQSAPRAAELLEDSGSGAEGGARRRRTPGERRITPPARARALRTATSRSSASFRSEGGLRSAGGTCGLLYWCCWFQTRVCWSGHLTWVTCSQNQEAMFYCRDPTRIAKPAGLDTSVRRGPEGRQDRLLTGGGWGGGCSGSEVPFQRNKGEFLRVQQGACWEMNVHLIPSHL